MKFTYFLAIFFCFVQNIASQTLIHTSVKATEVISVFTKEKPIEWAIPISQTEKLPLLWIERQSSFTQKEGIRTFIGYKDNSLVASLSIHNNNISAEVNQSENSIQISTDEQGFLLLHIDDNHLKCGACSEGICSDRKKIKETLQLSVQKINNEKKIANRDVLFVYRLALPVSYKYFSSPDAIFKSKIENVKTFWANTEAYLNDLYTRDIGVKFEIVNDERLIIQTPDNQPIGKFSSSGQLIDRSTNIIDSLIGRENYDLGVSISNSFRDVGGKASLNGAYGYHKGGATALAISSTIAHEIGHMFGSLHTFTTGGIGTYYTENYRGQSIMSYSFASTRKFFSLVSTHFIRNYLKKLGYYQDKERTKLIKEISDFDHINYPFGIKIPNQAPVINRNKLKKEYKIPSYTYFQFRISATDADDTELLYMAQPADINKKNHAQFYTYKGTTNNTISFEPSYADNGNFIRDTHHLVKEGDFTFWLGVNDANPQEEKAVKYDLYETKVKVISGTPFHISSDIKPEYKVGEKILLKWNVDNKVFDPNSKVRILLSDDLGKTYKHTIVESTENDGEYEFTIPNILIGETEFGKNKKSKLPAGAFKVEVIDHIAYAKTNTAPYKNINHQNVPYGGFKIIPNNNSIPPLQFKNLPKNITVSCSKNIPEKETLQVTGGCNPKVEVSDVIKNRTCANSYTIERTYTASDNCGSASITHTQIITIKDEQAPIFNGTLPADISVTEDKIPIQTDLTATDNCSTDIPVIKTQETKQEGNNKIIIYKWEATDECGNKTEHMQRIKIIANDDFQNTILYPNPIKESVHIKTNEKVLEIKIFDYSGRLIKILPSKPNNTYNVSFLTTGNYIFVVKTITGTHNFKILKM